MKKHNPNLTFNARNNRKKMTSQEKRLWYEYLRKYPVNFLRQKVIDNYIVDFYCSKAKVAIEVDGDYHLFTKTDKEKIRIKNIEKYGISVIRIPNYYIDTNFSKCCQIIDNIVQEKLVDER